ncbi:protein kinase-like domain, concanavalin A-like lectin/glucanase domain protein [Tanacetum coccineum]
MLRVSPLTLTGTTKRWLDRVPSEATNTWDLLKRIFILRFFPPSKTSRQLEEIHNFTRKEERRCIKREKDIMIFFLNAPHMISTITRRYESCNEIYYGYHCLPNEEVKCVKETESRIDSPMVTLGNNSPSGNMLKLEETLGKYLKE